MKKTKLILDYALILAVAILIIVFAVIREQSFIKTLPTLITLIVQLMMVKASRYAFLLGGINAMLYGISYFNESLYFSLVSAVLISAPIQLYSFVVWSKKENKDAPPLRFLGMKKLILSIVLSLIGWGICVFGLSGLFETAVYPTLDSYLFVMGITVSLLAAWGYIDSQYMNVLSTALGLILWILLTIQDPANFNYVILYVYNLYRIIQISVSWTIKYYKNQKKNGGAVSNVNVCE